jgi:hypothetical protein
LTRCTPEKRLSVSPPRSSSGVCFCSSAARRRHGHSAALHGQIEIETTDSGPFSQGGDIGSLIVDADRRAVALLFAGSDLGGSNGLGLTFANPIREVLDALKADLFFS